MPDDQRRRRNRGPSDRRPKPPRRDGHNVVDLPTPTQDRPQLKKLRIATITLGFLVLAGVSTVFGMMMAVASDLPQLEQRQEYKAAKNSILLDSQGRKLATLTGYNNRILVQSDQISSNVKRAVVAIEDQRFYEHKGVDYKGIGRALWTDLRRGEVSQGASTITQQFVKNALLAQNNRSVFQKLKEASLAYQLERRWSKDKILTEYLNTVYFGEGAYGIESAARVYFGWNHPGCQPNCALVLDPAESALLAGMIASPAAWNPIQNPNDALTRRNIVLLNMRTQGLLDSSQYESAKSVALPPRGSISPPTSDLSEVPYFSSWMQQQLVDRYGAGTAFAGGLKVRTTLDLDYQKAAEAAITQNLAGSGPSAALVAIDNDTGGIRAMVGGDDYNEIPFNLATQGKRQPGSAFKPFTLVAALAGTGRKKYRLDSRFASRKVTIGGYVVNNYNDSYFGSQDLAQATANSDNSVYAQLGIQGVGVKAVADMAYKMGIKTKLSENGAMILGGTKLGISPLEMADSYTSIANNGERISGSFAPYKYGPISFTKVEGPGIKQENKKRKKRIFGYKVAQDAQPALASVINGGTGKDAALGDGEFAAGKTGTTENYGDAWFVGFNDQLTVAIWVGYPDKVKPMETEFGGEPVAGGTYPANIWRDFITSVNEVNDARAENKGKTPKDLELPQGEGPAPDSEEQSTDEGAGGETRERETPDSTPEFEQNNGGGTDGGGDTPSAPNTPAPDPAPGTGSPTPDAPPTPPPSSGGTGGTGGAQIQSYRHANKRLLADRQRRY